MKKKVLAVSMLILSVFDVGFSQTISASKSTIRIIRATEPPELSLDEEQETKALQVVNIAVGEGRIDINKPFDANDNWLKDLRIEVKNVSDKKITCIGVSFGLLAEIDTKLQMHESWPWALGFYRGKCGLTGETIRRLKLKPGETVTLDGSDIPRLYLMSMKKMGLLKKAVLNGDALVKFGNRDSHEIPLSFLPTTTYLEDEAY